MDFKHIPHREYFNPFVFDSVKALKSQSQHLILLHGDDSQILLQCAKDFVMGFECRNKLCRQCSHCHEIESARFSDLLEYPIPEKEYKLDEIKKIIEFVHYTPLQSHSGKRFVILPDVDKLNIRSANYLLKTFEEPPPHTFIILTTTRLGGVIPTIRSRSVSLRTPQFQSQQVSDILLYFAKAYELENLEQDLDNLQKIIRGNLALGLFLIRGNYVSGLFDCLDLFSEKKLDVGLKKASQISKGFQGSVLDFINLIEIAYNYCYRTTGVADGSSKYREILNNLRKDSKSQLTAFNQQLILESVFLNLRSNYH